MKIYELLKDRASNIVDMFAIFLNSKSSRGHHVI